jgi:hypothetical protein
MSNQMVYPEINVLELLLAAQLAFTLAASKLPVFNVISLSGRVLYENIFIENPARQ